MNRPELYHKTVDILYQAYFNDTLRHGDCSMCAVGNICAGNGVRRLVEKEGPGDFNYYNNGSWSLVFSTTILGQEVDDSFINPLSEEYEPNIARVIAATGYHWIELAAIEKAFESAKGEDDTDERMFNGLVAVLEALKQIHEVEDNEPEVAKFRTHYTTLSKTV